MKKLFSVLVFMLALIASSAQTNTSITNLLYSVLIITNTSEADIQKLLSRVQEYQQVPIRGSARQIISLSRDRYDFLVRDSIFKNRGFVEMSVEDVDHRMQNIAGKSLEYGFRDWLEKNDLFNRMDSWSESLIQDSIAVDEELISPLNGVYDEATQSWWKRVGKKSFTWGVQAQASPYTFASFKFSEDGKTSLYTHVRIYLFDHFSANQRVEVIVSAPIANGWSVTTGASYSTASKSDRNQCVGIVRLEYAVLKKQDVRFSVAYKPGDPRFFQVALGKSF